MEGERRQGSSCWDCGWFLEPTASFASKVIPKPISPNNYPSPTPGQRPCVGGQPCQTGFICLIGQELSRALGGEASEARAGLFEKGVEID